MTTQQRYELFASSTTGDLTLLVPCRMTNCQFRLIGSQLYGVSDGPILWREVSDQKDHSSPSPGFSLAVLAIALKQEFWSAETCRRFLFPLSYRAT
jgi:cobalamin biosynthesis protein CobD/CbiB